MTEWETIVPFLVEVREHSERLLSHLQNVRGNGPIGSKVLLHILQRTAEQASRLIVASAGSDAELDIIAWCARNLLELLIWTRYVTTSPAHAVRFTQDYAHDVKDFIVELEPWVREMKRELGFSWPADRDAQLQELLSLLSEEAPTHNLPDNPQGYLRIARAARTVGLQAEFKKFNQLYSKIVHATSFSVLGWHRDIQPTVTGDIFLLKAYSYGAGIVGWSAKFLDLRIEFKT